MLGNLVRSQLTRFTDRIKSFLGGSASPSAASTPVDPLDYDQVIHLDAEDLAEQGILSSYRDLLPTLKRYASSPLEVTEDIDHDAARYSVSAGGCRYEIWEDGAQTSDGWTRATIAFFQIVNANLSESPYKFYALYGGNDLSGIFLTDEEFSAARRAIANRSNWPWLPVGEPPHYGYPVENAI